MNSSASSYGQIVGLVLYYAALLEKLELLYDSDQVGSSDSYIWSWNFFVESL